jgi:hypothetical protein
MLFKFESEIIFLCRIFLVTTKKPRYKYPYNWQFSLALHKLFTFIKIVTAVFEKVVISYFWGTYEGPLLLELHHSEISGADLGCTNSGTSNNEIRPTAQALASHILLLLYTWVAYVKTFLRNRVG